MECLTWQLYGIYEGTLQSKTTQNQSFDTKKSVFLTDEKCKIFFTEVTEIKVIRQKDPFSKSSWNSAMH